MCLVPRGVVVESGADVEDEPALGGLLPRGPLGEVRSRSKTHAEGADGIDLQNCGGKSCFDGVMCESLCDTWQVAGLEGLGGWTGVPVRNAFTDRSSDAARKFPAAELIRMSNRPKRATHSATAPTASSFFRTSPAKKVACMEQRGPFEVTEKKLQFLMEPCVRIPRTFCFRTTFDALTTSQRLWRKKCNAPSAREHVIFYGTNEN